MNNRTTLTSLSASLAPFINYVFTPNHPAVTTFLDQEHDENNISVSAFVPLRLSYGSACFGVKKNGNSKGILQCRRGVGCHCVFIGAFSLANCSTLTK